MKFWTKVDQALAISKRYRLSGEERDHIGKVEQEAYEANIPAISSIMEEFDQGLSQRGFWTKCTVEKNRLGLRYSIAGYYGPGGFSSVFHVSGPLVLGELNPQDNSGTPFYKNDLDQNVKIGADFDPIGFRAFIERNIASYMTPENLILSKEQYERIRDLYSNQ